MMKHRGYEAIVFLICLLFIFSCSEKPANPAAEYGNALVDSYKRGQHAGETANLDAVKKAVQYYNATNGKLPGTLDDAKEFIGNDVDLSKFDYNPETGIVTLKK
jgi:hypothetical protein